MILAYNSFIQRTLYVHLYLFDLANEIHIIKHIAQCNGNNSFIVEKCIHKERKETNKILLKPNVKNKNKYITMRFSPL